MKTSRATSHFVSESNAYNYYKILNPEFSPKNIRDLVKDKISQYEIFIGEPILSEEQELSINSEGRYIIHYQ